MDFLCNYFRKTRCHPDIPTKYQLCQEYRCGIILIAPKHMGRSTRKRSACREHRGGPPQGLSLVIDQAAQFRTLTEEKKNPHKRFFPVCSSCAISLSLSLLHTHTARNREACYFYEFSQMYVSKFIKIYYSIFSEFIK